MLMENFCWKITSPYKVNVVDVMEVTAAFVATMWKGGFVDITSATTC